MASRKKVAVVTGGNKGIGYAIVRGLCKQYDGDVILTARDEGRGNAAVSDLIKAGFQPKFHQMDITDKASIEKLKTFLQTTYGGLDILVNNAGMAYKNASTAPFSEQAEVTCKTNFWGTLDVCRILFPLLRSHARVVNVSSFVSLTSLSKCSPELQTRLKDSSMTMDNLEKIIHEFVDAAKADNHQDQGFPNSAYGMSKVGVTVLSIILDRELSSQGKQDVIVNACCPGYVDTDMSSHKGTKTIDEGADTPVYLAMLHAGSTSPKGNFVSDRTIKKWE